MEKGSKDEQKLMKQKRDSKQRGTENKCRTRKDLLTINIFTANFQTFIKTLIS